MVLVKQVNINTATKEELESVLGLGTDLAEDILNYREQNGPFKTWDELKNISGITDSVIYEIRNSGVTL